MGVVTEIWRHPIKSHGHERIDQVDLSEGKNFPWDRRWAVAHERSCFDVDRPRWQPCSEFSRGSKSPRLQAITCVSDPSGRSLTLSHPDCVDITIDPENELDAGKFIQWIMPVSNGSRALPARLVRAETAMTDTDYASVSLINLATHRDVEAKMGQKLNPLRWRGNFLIDGF
ncbi:MAG: MOSC N-terminal beta barrel domain-containing protein [Paracoccaceae bacterium]|nr:MOSC N-terminal beta barrel domain-containing protein [Paracoccaceae bacterium]